MTQQERNTRKKRAQALVDLVSKAEGGYRVQSSRDPNTSYFVSKPNGRVVCTCSDFEKHSEDPRFECKHILAVREAYRLGKVNGNGTNKAQIDLEAQAMFGDPEAARQLDAQVQGKAEAPAEPGILPQPAAHCALCGGELPLAGDPSLSCKSCELKAQERIGSPRRDTLPGPQDNHGSMDPPSGIPTEIPEPEEEILPTLEGPWEEAVQLESCLVCHTKTPTDEMILVSVPSGTGLVCHTCYDGRKACPGPDPGACTFCGARLPIEQLITAPISSGAGLLCEGCYAKSRACSRCGDHFLVERMIAIREPGFFGYYCPECAKEYEAERAKKAKVILTLADRIARANEVLASFGPIAIETDQKGYTGFGSQYVIDAVNQALGFDGWKYDLVNHQTEKAGEKAHRAMVLLQLSIRMNDGSWFCRGPVVGGSTNSDGADALKGAITDGLKKAFSQWSIGNRAYRGELKAAKA